MSDLNDPRVLLAAERTLLAWNRTCLALMGFGFVIERFGLFLEAFGKSATADAALQQASHVIGIGFLLLGVVLALLSTLQFRALVKTLSPREIPRGYWVQLSVFANLIMAALGLSVAVYLAL